MADKQSLVCLSALKYFIYLFYFPALLSFPGCTIVVTTGNEPRSKLPMHLCRLYGAGNSETTPLHIRLYL